MVGGSNPPAFTKDEKGPPDGGLEEIADMQGWICERHDKVTYCVSHSRKLGGGTIVKITRNKWEAESDDTGETVVCPTLTKAFWWVIDQAAIAERMSANQQ